MSPPTMGTMNSGDTNLPELGNFLRARRAELGPRAVGLPDNGTHRRVPGLRREEVALLAAISTDYYTRLEQGRLPASAPVLAALSRVLLLDADQRDYLYDLAGKDARQPGRPRRRTAPHRRYAHRSSPCSTSSTAARRSCRARGWTSWPGTPWPRRCSPTSPALPERHRNYIRLVFTDPAMRELYDDWEGVARTCVAYLRMEAAHSTDDPNLAALVGELSVHDDHFRQWWAAHHVAHKGIGTKTLHHPVAGDLVLDWDTLTCAADADQQIVIWTAADTATEAGLQFLASWAADPVETRAVGQADPPPSRRLTAPGRGHGRTRTFSASRPAIARYPSGTRSRPTVRSNTRPGSTDPSRTSGSSSSM